MTTKYLYILSILFLSFSVSFAQTTERQEISGEIFFNLLDKEGITIFNLSSNQGTITNDKGEFTIPVAVNDVLEFSSLLIQSKKIVISNKDLKNQYLKVFLVELVNNLDEVVVLEQGLTGDLDKDVENVEVFRPDLESINLGVDDLLAYQFSPDYKTGVENIITRQGQFYNMADGMALVKLVSGLFKNDKKELEKKELALQEKINALKLSNKFSNNYYTQNFKIPAQSVQAFIAFAEDNLDRSLLLKANEMQLIEYLGNTSKVFLETHK